MKRELAKREYDGKWMLWEWEPREGFWMLVGVKEKDEVEDRNLERER